MTDRDGDFGIVELRDHDFEAGLFMMPASGACKVINGASSWRAFSEGAFISQVLADLKEQESKYWVSLWLFYPHWTWPLSLKG